MGAGQPSFQVLGVGWRVVQHAQNLANRDGAGTGWRHAANAVLLVKLWHRVVNTEGLTDDGTVSLQVRRRQLAWIAGMPLHLVDYGVGDIASHECTRTTAGNALQYLRKFRVAQHMAYRPRSCLCIVEIRFGHWVVFQARFGRQQCSHAGAYRKSLPG